MSINQSNLKSFPYKRRLKILESVAEHTKAEPLPGVSYRPVNLRPCLMLCGKWFEDAGFAIGGQVSIKVRKNKLVIKPIQDANPGGAA